MDRQEFTKLLLSGDIRLREVYEHGVEVMGVADKEVDSARFTFGSNEGYVAFMEQYLLGELEEVDAPEVGCVVLYFDEEGNVVHMGKVFEEGEELKVRSKIAGSKAVLLHPPGFPPVDLPGDITLSYVRLSDCIK